MNLWKAQLSTMLRYSVLVLFLCLLGVPLSAQQPVTRTRTVSKQYAPGEVGWLIITNQLGGVKITTRTGGGVEAQMRITVKKNGQMAAEQLLEKIVIVEDMREDGTLMLTTDLQGKVANKPGEFVGIQYELTIPDDLDLEVYNELGNLEMGDSKADHIRLELSYGRHDVGYLSGKDVSVTASFGTGSFFSGMARGELALAYAGDVFVGSLGAVMLELEGTNVQVQKADSILLDNEYGKVSFESLGALSGDISFGDLLVEELNVGISISGDHAKNIRINKLAPVVRTIDLDLIYTPCVIQLPPGLGGTLDAAWEGGKLEWKGDTLRDEKHAQAEKRQLLTAGFGGERENLLLRIRAKQSLVQIAQ